MWDMIGVCRQRPPALQAAEASQANRYWMVSGTLSPTVSVNPVWPMSAWPGSVPTGTAGRYTAELRAADGMVLSSARFDPIVEEYQLPDQGAQFRAYLPDAPGAAQVVLLDGAATIFSRGMSAHAPSVSVTEPSAGASWSATGFGPIRWSASDADGDDLTYVVMYSRDAGGSWINLATGLTQPRYDVDLEALGGVVGRGQIRVLANDGMRVGSGDSGLFSIASKLPIVAIHSPAGATRLTPGETLVLMGGGWDREDGELPGSFLQWTDSIHGALGSGTQVMVPDLGFGRHTITLTGADADGGIGTAQIDVLVGLADWLPLLMK